MIGRQHRGLVQAAALVWVVVGLIAPTPLFAQSDRKQDDPIDEAVPPPKPLGNTGWGLMHPRKARRPPRLWVVPANDRTALVLLASRQRRACKPGSPTVCKPDYATASIEIMTHKPTRSRRLRWRGKG